MNRTLLFAAAIVAVLVVYQSGDAGADEGNANSDSGATVVAGSSGTTVDGGMEHVVECQAPGAEPYEVVVDAHTVYTIPEGAPCPPGPKRPLPPSLDELLPGWDSLPHRGTIGDCEWSAATVEDIPGAKELCTG